MSRIKWKIHKGDLVEVITGEERGKRGRVKSVDVERGRVVVEGVNRAVRHLRPSQSHPQGGRIETEMPLDISNVMLVSEETGRRQRVRRVTFTMTDAGGKRRVFRYRVGVKDNKPIGARDRELAERHEKVRGQQGAG